MGSLFERDGLLGNSRYPDSWYDIAQICLEGHVVNRSSQKNSESNEVHCHTCGEETLTKCTQCGTDIRGLHYINGSPAYHYSRPNHCHNCGEPFPWIISHIKLIGELVDELGLEKNDRETLRNEAKHIVCDTQRTTLARSIFKKILSSLNSGMLKTFSKSLIDMGIEKVNEIVPDSTTA